MDLPRLRRCVGQLGAGLWGLRIAWFANWEPPARPRAWGLRLPGTEPPPVLLEDEVVDEMPDTAGGDDVPGEKTDTAAR